MADVKSLKINGVNFIDFIYPVGAIFQTVDKDFLPESEFGGTWERIKGMVLVGVDEEDEDFELSELTGGEKSHTLTNSEIPSHNHSFKEGSHSVLWGTGGATVYFSNTQATAGSPPSNNPCTKQGSWNSTNTTGGGSSHNNLQPYYTVYIWKRTA